MSTTELDIRIKKPANLPMVGKFTDSISLENAEKPVYMYTEDEEIENDPEEMEKEDVVKDGAYYAALKKRKHIIYKKKEILRLEDSTFRVEGGAPEGIMYEGEAWEPGMKDGDGNAPAAPINYRARKKEINDNEKPFNYALFQVIKSKGADGKIKTEVNIVPVKGFYLFKKPSVMPMKSLDLIDDDFELKMQADQARLQKYKNLFRSNPEALKGANAEATTAATSNTLNADGTAASKFVLPPVFGMAMKQKVKKGLKKNANSKAFLDETGADMDQINDAVGTYQGDYEGYRPNDDMGFADEGNDFAQNLEIKEATEETEKIETLHDDGEEDDDDSEEEDDEGAAGDDGGGGSATEEATGATQVQRGLLSGVAKSKTSGQVDDRVLLEARQAGQRMAANEKLQAALKAASAAGGAAGTGTGTSDGDGEGESSRKRGRGTLDASTTAAAGGAGGDGEESKAKRLKKGAYELSEEGITEYLRSYGEPVPLDELKAQFKAKVKAMNKQRKDSGVTTITDLIKRLCKTTVDPVKGKLISLK